MGAQPQGDYFGVSSCPMRRHTVSLMSQLFLSCAMSENQKLFYFMISGMILKGLISMLLTKYVPGAEPMSNLT